MLEKSDDNLDDLMFKLGLPKFKKEDLHYFRDYCVIFKPFTMALRAFLSGFIFLVNLTKNWSRDQFLVYFTKIHHKYHQVLHHDYHGESKILCRAFLIFTMKKP